jgi:hypothetical protein
LPDNPKTYQIWGLPIYSLYHRRSVNDNIFEIIATRNK